MNRVVVVGGPGAGKTTLARRLATTIGAPHVELDWLWWQRGWVAREPAEFRTLVHDALGQRWVVDGFYVDELAPTVWPSADTLVRLDLPRRTSVRRAVLRSAARVARRTELWNGNRQRPSVLSPRSVWRFWQRWPAYPATIAAQLDQVAVGVDVVRLRSPSEVERWLRSAGEVGD